MQSVLTKLETMRLRAYNHASSSNSPKHMRDWIDADFDAIKAALQDAERYQALMASVRMTAMGWAGFGRPEADQPPDDNGYRHVTMNFWTTDTDKPMDGDAQAEQGRKLFGEYVDQCVINERKKAGE